MTVACGDDGSGGVTRVDADVDAGHESEPDGGVASLQVLTERGRAGAREGALRIFRGVPCAAPSASSVRTACACRTPRRFVAATEFGPVCPQLARNVPTPPSLGGIGRRGLPHAQRLDTTTERPGRDGLDPRRRLHDRLGSRRFESPQVATVGGVVVVTINYRLGARLTPGSSRSGDDTAGNQAIRTDRSAHGTTSPRSAATRKT